MMGMFSWSQYQKNLWTLNTDSFYRAIMLHVCFGTVSSDWPSRAHAMYCIVSCKPSISLYIKHVLTQYL